MHRSPYPTVAALEAVEMVPGATGSPGRIMALAERVANLCLWDQQLLLTALVAIDPLMVRDALDQLEFPELVAQAEAEREQEMRYAAMASARAHYLAVYRRLTADPQLRDAVLEFAAEGRPARKMLQAELAITANQLSQLVKAMTGEAEGRRGAYASGSLLTRRILKAHGFAVA